MSQELKSIIQSFKYDKDPDVKVKLKDARVRKNSPTGRKLNSRKMTKSVVTDTTKLPDLGPSLSSNLTVLFVGFNPGVQSSIQQHHYAHHSNLFWKLFNQSRILERMVAKGRITNVGLQNDRVLNNFLKNGCSAKDDFDLVTYGIGFTDLALRCTATAAELTNDEKLDNIPRLLQEIEFSNAKNVVFIGKGIWEMVVKYFSLRLGIKVKLDKVNFRWGKIEVGIDERYNGIIDQISSQIPRETAIHVFPSTSGLVASMSFQEKLQLWQNLSDSI